MAWYAIGSAVVSTVVGVASANSQKNAAKKATAAQVAAANDQISLDKAVYQDQRNLSTPDIKAGSEAKARQMLMAGYTPTQVKNYLKSVDASIGDGGALAFGAAQTPAPTTQLAGLNFNAATGEWNFNAATGEWSWAPQPATPTPAPDTQYDWVDAFNPDDFLKSMPGYQSRLRAGNEAIERSKSSQGKFYSASTGKALGEFNQDYASGHWNDLYSQYGGLAGDGQDAAGTVVNVVGQYGQNVGNALGNQGDSRASGYLRQGEADVNRNAAIAQGVGSIFGVAKQQKWGF